jgi:glucose-6-phosphate dehydrogenase assembly protein OpcA
MTTLWETTGTDVVKALGHARRAAGSMISGLALTLVVVADEKRVAEAEVAAVRAASAHPCRVLIVVRRQIESAQPRLDAEISVGGRLGPGEAVVMRMYGRLALHAESVVLPLLAPDVPVVTWWHGEPPTKIAHDPLGVFADRRVTDSAQAPDPIAALRIRAEDFAPGDTDLAWTRATPWRAVLAGAFDSATGNAVKARIGAEAGNPSAWLIAGWLKRRLGVQAELVDTSGPGITEVYLAMDDGSELSLNRPDGHSAVLHRSGVQDRRLPLHRRDIGEQLAEELRRLDPDQPYAGALSAATGLTGLDARSPVRVHEWLEPALANGGSA